MKYELKLRDHVYALAKAFLQPCNQIRLKRISLPL